MNFFEQLRSIATVAAVDYCARERWELDAASATMQRLSKPGEPFRFVVRYFAMTPGGDFHIIFVQVNQEGNSMVARVPFINSAPNFNLRPFLAKWYAPREKSQGEIVSEAVYENFKKNMAWFFQHE